MTRSEIKRARAERERAVECMWEDGFSLRAIADTLGTTEGTIKTVLWEMRGKGMVVERAAA